MWIEEKDGKFKFRERYTDPLTGKEKKVCVTYDKNTTATRKAAADKLRAKINKALNITGKEHLTVEALTEKYLEFQKKTVRESTYRRNISAVKNTVDILGKKTLINKLTVSYITDKLLAKNKTARTMNQQLARMKSIFRWGYSQELIDDISFCERMKPFKDKPHKETIADKYLERDQLKTMLESMENTEHRLATAFLALSGLRVGEFLALNKSDVSIKNRTVNITKTYNAQAHILGPTKTGETRSVYIQDQLMQICKEINACMNEKKLRLGIRSPLFFFDDTGAYMNYTAYMKYLKEKTLAVKGKQLTPHSLRHTHASLLMEQGMDLDAISRRLGHSSSVITKEIYLHVTERMREKDNEKIKEIQII